MDSSASISFLGSAEIEQAAEDTLTNFSAQYSEAPGPHSESLIDSVGSSIQPPRPIIRLQDHLAIPPSPSIPIASTSKTVSFKPLVSTSTEPTPLPACMPRQEASAESDGVVQDTPLYFSRASSCDSLQSFQIPSQVCCFLLSDLRLFLLSMIELELNSRRSCRKGCIIHTHNHFFLEFYSELWK